MPHERAIVIGLSYALADITHVALARGQPGGRQMTGRRAARIPRGQQGSRGQCLRSRADPRQRRARSPAAM